MKIEIGSFTLCAGGLESPEDLSRGAEDTVQVLDGIRAAYAGTLNRGNRRHTLRFSVTRSYADWKAAETALLDHPAEVPATGDVKLTTEGSSPAVRYLRDATCHAFAAKLIGVSIIWTYTITGGEISPTA